MASTLPRNLQALPSSLTRIVDCYRPAQLRLLPDLLQVLSLRLSFNTSCNSNSSLWLAAAVANPNLSLTSCSTAANYPIKQAVQQTSASTSGQPASSADAADATASYRWLGFFRPHNSYRKPSSDSSFILVRKPELLPNSQILWQLPMGQLLLLWQLQPVVSPELPFPPSAVALGTGAPVTETAAAGLNYSMNDLINLQALQPLEATSTYQVPVGL